MEKIELSLILPCFNEAEHFTKSVSVIHEVLKKTGLTFEIIFVEDNSKDNTKELIKNFIHSQASSQIHAIYHTANQGRGKSVSDGIKKAQGKYVGFIDIDCEISPKYIPDCVDTLKKGYDVVCGKRTYQTSFQGLIRALASKAYAFLVKFILKTSLVDTEAGYKFFNRKKILSILDTVKDTGWFWDTEIMVRAEVARFQISFIPVLFNRRTDKKSTVNLVKDTLDYVVKLMHFRNRLQQERKMSHNQSQNIYHYWQYKSPAFSNQYISIFGIPLSPVGIFLQKRHRKISHILSRLQGRIVLDVGCGSGIFMQTALELGKFPVGVDYSQQMLDTARKNLHRYKPSQYKLIHSDAQKLPLANASVDIVLASGLTDYLKKESIENFFKEIERVLKRNGYVIITFPKNESPFAFLRSNLGLLLREKILHLPPIETQYSRKDIQKLYQTANIFPIEWQTVLFTMWIVVGKKQI